MTNKILTDAAALISDPGVWVSWLAAAVLGLVCLGIGLAISRRTGVLGPDVPRAEAVGIGLGMGLLAVAAAYAAIMSRGASSFTPVFVALIVAAAIGRGRMRLRRPDRGSFLAGIGAMSFLGSMILLYGLTIAPSPRDGVQPIEFMDEAYYAVLSSELRETGLESVYAPAGFDDLPGVSDRSWYHWGEAWLGGLALEFPGVSTMHARYHVALPLLLLAITCAAGSIVGRLVGRDHRTKGFVLGAFGMLTIGPVPIVLGDHFDWWARPVGFTITQYGMAFVVALIGLYVIVTRPSRVSVGSDVATGALAGALVASHVLIAATAAVGIAFAEATRWATDRPASTGNWIREVGRPSLLSLGVVGVTIVWGILSGHGFGGGGTVAGVVPFDTAWQRALIFAALGGGVLPLGILGAVALRRSQPLLSALAVGSMMATLAGAVFWGIRLADFNSFHFFYGSLSVFLTPVAVTGLVACAVAARRQGRRWMPTIAMALLLGQGAVGIGATFQRLYEFGPGHYDPVPVAAIEYISQLPEEAKLAYSCQVFEEAAIWDARLISLTAHTGRTVVPMCFQADIFGPQLGRRPDPAVESPFFAVAPQRVLYPGPDARPSATEIRAFMREHRIDYIYADASHPNVLLPDARPIFSSGSVTIFDRL